MDKIRDMVRDMVIKARAEQKYNTITYAEEAKLIPDGFDEFNFIDYGNDI